MDGRTDVDLLLAEGWEEIEQDDENKQVLQVSCCTQSPHAQSHSHTIHTHTVMR